MQEGWVWYTLCQVVNPLTQICTSKSVNPSRSVSGGFCSTKMLLQFVLNTRTHDHTQDLRYSGISRSVISYLFRGWSLKASRTHRKQSQNPPSPPNSPDLADSVSQFFGALKVAVREKGFRSDDEIIAEVAASTKFKLVLEGDSCPPVRLAQGCQVYGDYVEKLRKTSTLLSC